MHTTVESPVGIFGTYLKQMTLKRLRETFPLVYLDPKFQRFGGAQNSSGWARDNCKDFCKSILSRSVTNKIELASVKRNLDQFAEALEDNRDNGVFDKEIERAYKYYSELSGKHREVTQDCFLEQKKKFKYVSVDGYNTQSSIYFFISSEDQIREEMGEEYVQYKLKTQFPDGKWRTFEALEEEQQNMILNHKLPVFVHSCITVVEMKEHFQRLNQSTALNDQEKRNGFDTELAETIRNYGKKPSIRNFTTAVFRWKEGNFHKREQEQLLAQMLIFQQHPNYSLKSKGLNSLYENVSKFDTKSLDFYLEEFEKINQAFSNSSTQNKTGEGEKSKKLSFAVKKKWTNGQFFAFLSFLKALKQENYSINYDKSVDLINKFESVHNDMFVKASSIYSKDDVSKSYEAYCTYYTTNVNYKKLIKRWQTLLTSGLNTPEVSSQEVRVPLEQELLKERLIQAPSVSRPRFSVQQMMNLASLQGWKDRWGNEIKASDIRSENVIHVAHLVPHSKGGSSDTSNLELQFKKDNLENGSNNLEAHFDFQKKKTL
jgi:hypothetical protein